MANTQLFQSAGSGAQAALVRNEAGGLAYQRNDKHMLAQYAATGCLNATFYIDAQAQLETVLNLCERLDNAFIARTALYCRERGYMKDMPALLAAVLAARGAPELAQIFPRVVDNGKMLRNFVQILRSGATGRKSLGTRPKKLVQNWLNNASERELLAAAVGNNPSLADVVKMVHPKPKEAWREAFFAWLIGKPYQAQALPPVLAAYEVYKKEGGDVPQVPFQMLTALDMKAEQWAAVARQSGWHMVRMNLNTFARHGVYELPGMTQVIADKLRDAEAIAKARVFPYQLLAAYLASAGEAPQAVRNALQDAMELALKNVPVLEGKVVICADVSGSMHSSVTGYRAGATSKVRCIDVAGLVAAAILRNNQEALVLPFAESVRALDLNPRDSVMSNAQKLAATPGGGTNCSAPLAHLNRMGIKADLVIYVSDNESWMDARRHGSTATQEQWKLFKRRNPQAKLVCLDITPSPSTQVAEAKDVLNIGGFSDDVFKLIAAFAAGQLGAEHWVGEVEAISL